VPSPNSQKFTTKAAKSRANPVWNEQKDFLIGDYEVDCFQIILQDKEGGDAVGSCLIPVKNFAAGSGWIVRDYDLESRGCLRLEVKVDCGNPGVNRPTEGKGQADPKRMIEADLHSSPRVNESTLPQMRTESVRAAARVPELDSRLVDGPAVDRNEGAQEKTAARREDVVKSNAGVYMSRWVKDFGQMVTIRAIGQGVFGVVTLVEDPVTHDQTALKSIEMKTAGGDISELFVQEVEMMIRLRHPCVLPIVGYSLPTSTSPGRIGTKYAINGSLRSALDARRSGSCPSFLDATGVSIILTGLAIGMKFIHSRGVIHRDLKPANILIDERGWPQIGDLGSSRLVSLDVTLTQNVGTPLYMAPEMYEECEYTSAIDVYAFALIAYEVLAGDYVFPPHISRLALMKESSQFQRPPFPEWVKPPMRQIIGLGWLPNVSARPSFESILTDLESANFDVTGCGDSSRIYDFVSHVRRIESESEWALS
jgi:hypothetical protein